MTCGQLPIGGCDLVDLGHTGPCVVNGRLSKHAKQVCKERGQDPEQVLNAQVANWSTPMGVQ